MRKLGLRTYEHKMHLITLFHLSCLCVDYTEQLKGKLTHADRTNATSWLKALSFINPYWHVWEEKPAKINF